MTSWIVMCAVGDGYSAQPFSSREHAIEGACAMLQRGGNVIQVAGGGGTIEAAEIRAICVERGAGPAPGGRAPAAGRD